jgi:hypothetical protein
MLELYYLADQSYPVELLSRVDELARLKSKLEEYKDVKEADA